MKSSYLGNQNTLKSIFYLAIPSMIAQLINVLYNIVDRIYVGNLPQIGEIALIGVGVCSPIVSFISSFAFLIGLGGAPIFSMALGSKDYQKAKKILANALLMSIVISTILIVLFYSLANQVLFLFGASENSITYARDYLYIYLVGTFFCILTTSLNQYLIAQGESVKAMCTTVIGCILNVGLDPLFMYALNLGVKGAAIATVISQFVSFVFVLYLLIRKSSVKLSFGNYDIKLMKQILKLGFSPFIIMSTDSLILILLNSALKLYGGTQGDFYIEIVTIVQAYQTLITGPLLGISSGTQPILGYNYGANNKELIIKAEKQILLIAVIFTSICFGLSFLVAKPFATLFIGLGKENVNMEIVNTSYKYIICYMIGIIPLAFQYVFVDGLTGLGQAHFSIWLSLIRKIVIYVPAIFIIPLITKDASGCFYAEPLGDICSAIISTICYLIYIPKVFKKMDSESNKQDIASASLN